jgi:hypothetical protein
MWADGSLETDGKVDAAGCLLVGARDHAGIIEPARLVSLRSHSAIRGYALPRKRQSFVAVQPRLIKLATLTLL